MITIKVSGLIVNNKNEILLIKEWSKKKKGYFWNLVKGTFDFKRDEGVLNTLIREVKEEIGLKVKVKGLLNIFEIKKRDDFLFQFNFLCESPKNNKFEIHKKSEKNEEIIERKWFNKKELEFLDRKDIMDRRVTEVIKQWKKGKIASLSSIKQIKF